MDDKHRWIVTAAADVDLAILARNLQAVGCQIEASMDELGMLIGTCDETTAGLIAERADVVDVSPDVATSINTSDLTSDK